MTKRARKKVKPKRAKSVPFVPELFDHMHGHPQYPELRLLAARILDENPDLARAIKKDGINSLSSDQLNLLRDSFGWDAFDQMSQDIERAAHRQRVDNEVTQAIVQQFSQHGFEGTLYSMASQFRHPDWVERERATPRPEGPTRTFYHFTSAVHAPLLLKYGITRGDVCIHPSEKDRNYNAPWLTTDPSHTRQGWAANPDGTPNSTFDKRVVRMAVAIPEGDPSLSTWVDICERDDVDPAWAEALNTAGGHKGWYVYNGLIPSSWIVQVDFLTGPQKVGTFGILSTSTEVSG
jgi:hypothetical protein